MLTKREVIEKRRRNKIDFINGDSEKSEYVEFIDKRSFKYKIEKARNVCDRANIIINANIVLTSKQLGLKFDKLLVTHYTNNFRELQKNIKLYNMGSGKIKLIVHYDPDLQKYEVIPSVSRSGIEITYIKHPIRSNYKTRIGKYCLKFDINKDMWFSENIQTYLELKNNNNKRLDLEYRKKGIL
jgi:hypothetical protein